MRRLVELTLRPDFTVDDEVASVVLANLSRADLRAYLHSLRQALRRRSVHVALEGGDPDTLGRTLRGRFPGRDVEVSRTRDTGGGVRVSSGDDILDASVAGYLRKVLGELGGT